jgi:alkylation response protein AidB-like acyl-CoA dehydrogenase
MRSFASDALAETGGAAEGDQFDALWRLTAEAGHAGLTLPRAQGGQGHGLLDGVLAFEALAEGGADPGFLFSLGVHQFAVAGPMISLATAEQQARWLPVMASGRALGAFAISEAGAGSDTFALAAVAREVENGFALSGEKTWVTNAPKAHLFLVSARTDDVAGAFGVSCFLVARDTPGVSIRPGPAKIGLEGAPWGTLVLDDAIVPASSLLGARGGAAIVFQEAMRWERCGLFAIPLGAQQRGLRECLARVAARKQFGQPLIENHAIARALALIKSRIEAARLLLYKAAASVDAGQADDMAISLAKAFVSETALDNALEMQKLYGALGVLSGSPPARLVNDIQPFRVLSGANEVHYQIMARLLRVMGG